MRELYATCLYMTGNTIGAKFSPWKKMIKRNFFISVMAQYRRITCDKIFICSLNLRFGLIGPSAYLRGGLCRNFCLKNLKMFRLMDGLLELVLVLFDSSHSGAPPKLRTVIVD